jgi:hypothetical protein
MAQHTVLNVVYGRAFANRWLLALTTRPAAALLATGKLRLSQDPAFAPTADSTVAALAANEADFTGYTSGGVTYATSGQLNVNPLIQGDVMDEVFVSVAGSPFVPNQLYGWWIDDGTDVVAAGTFGESAPIPISVPGDYLALQSILPVNLLQPSA